MRGESFLTEVAAAGIVGVGLPLVLLMYVKLGPDVRDRLEWDKERARINLAAWGLLAGLGTSLPVALYAAGAMPLIPAALVSVAALAGAPFLAFLF